MLSGLKGDAFAIWLEIVNRFERFQLKGQVPSAKQTKQAIGGITQKPNLAASGFKSIRGMPNEKISELLNRVKENELSLKEMRVKAEEWKSIEVLKAEFVKLAGMKTWEDIIQRYCTIVVDM